MMDFDDLDELEDEREAAQQAQAKAEFDGKPAWMITSFQKLQARRDGAKVLPGQLELPPRLVGPNAIRPLPPFVRLNPKQLEEMSPKSLPGNFSGMTFPHSTALLSSAGPEWFTRAFHRFGTLPADNRVKRVVRVEELPISGFDAAGGAGHKAFITLEYEKPDPELHTELFAKMPWDYFESETACTYRKQISTYFDSDGPEISTNCFLEHVFPFRIPKLYFCDISRETTNYILITECIPFGRRGRIENGRIVEEIERKPFDILPVCGKYQDYLLDVQEDYYYCIMRTMAQLAAWDQQGRYDSYFGPKEGGLYTEAEYLAKIGPRKPMKPARKNVTSNGAGLMVADAVRFATEVAPHIFTPGARDPAKLRKMREDIMEAAPYFEDIKAYIANGGEWVAASHLNLQADNAYFWRDSKGDMDCGVFDWCGFGRAPFVASFMGCLSGAEADVLDAQEEGLMKYFAAEYHRYGGPFIEWEEVLLRYRLLWISYAMDACQWVQRDIYREAPEADWKMPGGISDRNHPEFVGRWNVRCRCTTLINVLEYWNRRPFLDIFMSWKNGPGKPYITPFDKA